MLDKNSDLDDDSFAAMILKHGLSDLHANIHGHTGMIETQYWRGKKKIVYMFGSFVVSMAPVTRAGLLAYEDRL